MEMKNLREFGAKSWDSCQIDLLSKRDTPPVGGATWTNESPVKHYLN